MVNKLTTLTLINMTPEDTCSSGDIWSSPNNTGFSQLQGKFRNT